PGDPVTRSSATTAVAAGSARVGEATAGGCDEVERVEREELRVPFAAAGRLFDRRRGAARPVTVASVESRAADSPLFPAPSTAAPLGVDEAWSAPRPPRWTKPPRSAPPTPIAAATAKVAAPFSRVAVPIDFAAPVAAAAPSPLPAPLVPVAPETAPPAATDPP